MKKYIYSRDYCFVLDKTIRKKMPELEFLRLNISRYTSPESRNKKKIERRNVEVLNSIELIPNITGCFFSREEEGRASCNSNGI